jgi:hypothetical protein
MLTCSVFTVAYLTVLEDVEFEAKANSSHGWHASQVERADSPKGTEKRRRFFSSHKISVKIPKPSYPDDCLFAPILRDIKYEHTSIAMQSLFRCWPPIYMK